MLPAFCLQYNTNYNCNFNISKTVAMKKILFIVFTLSFLSARTNAQLTTRVVRDSLFIPWDLVYAPDSHIWFTQKNGYVCRLEPVSGTIDTIYHETATVIQGEGGMLGMCLHPNFPSPPFVYIAFNYLNGSAYKEKVVKYQYSGGTLSSPQIVIDNINAAGNHNGSRLLMQGNNLFITTGDATTASVAQNINAINGKILRVVQDGSIPTDNPIPGSPLWSWGHRNPQGMVFVNGKLFESEHGPNNDDEINIIQKGRNYGWPNVEGYCNTASEISFCTDSNVAEPINAWTPTLAVCGIDYYDHPMFPLFRKSLIMATLKDSKLYRLKLNAAQDDIDSVVVIGGVSFGRLRDVCVAPNGKIYISTSNSNASGTGTRIDKIIEIYDPSYVDNSNVGLVFKNGNKINIYPNPAANETTITIADAAYLPADYTIINTLGQAIMKGKLAGKEEIIKLGSIAPGIYHIRIEDNKKGLTTQKIVKE